ncbi:hypothetical protein VTJ83DRAFT_5639 [Remersonia thermophila]|uniref:25S rRNA (Uridine(2843)-N(3))-methyltransferase n=1 Tax=Remersonia thermophila TaxID=72144 RepID=A0ABR4D7D8_9PEZI
MTGKKRGTARPKPRPKPTKAHPSSGHDRPRHKEPRSDRSRDDQEEDQEVQGPKGTVFDSDPAHQQRVLDIFRRAFEDVLSSGRFTTKLQALKQALYDRDFARAFGDAENLEAYAARWSPTRALCYASVLCRLADDHLGPLLSLPDGGDPPAPDQPSPPAQLKAFCVGGGAAELVAVAALVHQHPSPLSASVTLLDSGPWDAVLSKLTAALTTPPPISRCASEAAKLSNVAFAPASRLASTFLSQDVLALDKAQLSALVGSTPLLVTLLFTLNELFTAAGVGKTTAFLLTLTSVVPPGSLLLVVDSPGSYSEASVGKEAKRYPMHWLLDRVVVDTTRREPVNGRRWVKVDEKESVWFRLPDGELDYPIQLENMRYQMHLYRAEDASQDEEET